MFNNNDTFFGCLGNTLDEVLVALKDATSIESLQQRVFEPLDEFMLYPPVELISDAADGIDFDTRRGIGCNILADLGAVVDKAAEKEEILAGEDLDDETYEQIIENTQSLFIELCGLFASVSRPLAAAQAVELDFDFGTGF